MVKKPTGEILSRLDFAAHSELRENVAVINTPDELENLFCSMENNPDREITGIILKKKNFSI